MEIEDWSGPDARGVRTRVRDVGASVTLRGRRDRRRFDQDFDAVALWPAPWRDLARDWLAGAERLRWSTLLKRAGPQRIAAAHEVLDALLAAGWIELDERRGTGGRWVAQGLAILDLERCREALGLSNREQLAMQWEQARNWRLDATELCEAARGLECLPLPLALRRHGWLVALDRWTADRRYGTRRDFAFFASGQTKGIPEADWKWLADAVDLGGLGIDPHTPMLLIRAPLRLVLPTGSLALDAAPDFIALTAATVAAAEAVEGRIARYRLIENRTTFEHACRELVADEAVIWIPGRPPRWWRDAVSHLLRVCPAPALIEADPDPAGIAIACEAGEVWSLQCMSWSPHNMDRGVLDRLPATQPLGSWDIEQLDRLIGTPLPALLRELVLAMRERAIKGEQEGLTVLRREQ